MSVMSVALIFVKVKLVRRTDFSKRFHRRQITLRLNRRERSVSPRVRMIRVRAMRDQVIEQAKASEKRGERKCGFARVIGCVNVAVRLQERPCYVEFALAVSRVNCNREFNV
jgi:hypothetical protein